jgi:hypothetical protein
MLLAWGVIRLADRLEPVAPIGVPAQEVDASVPPLPTDGAP